MFYETSAERETVEIERGRKDNRRGLPRPLARSRGVLRPVPWTNSDDWGILHDVRAHLCMHNSECLVCGKRVDEGYIFTASENAPVNAHAGDLERWAIDGGPLHSRCAKMTVAHCAHMRRELLTASAYMVRYCRQPS